MSKAIEIHSRHDDLVAIAARASLFALLQQALRRQHHPQELPGRLYDDLGIFTTQWPDADRYRR
jgi:hypothetical protein